MTADPPDRDAVRAFWDRCLHDAALTRLAEAGIEGLEADAGRLMDLAAEAGGPYAAQGAARGISRALEEAWEERAQTLLGSLRRPVGPSAAPSAPAAPPEPVQRRREAAHRAPTPAPVRDRRPA